VQLRRDALPVLRENGVKMICVGSTPRTRLHAVDSDPSLHLSQLSHPPTPSGHLRRFTGALRLFLLSVGTLETARKFCDHVDFPRENLYADPENSAYTALNLVKGVQQTFFTIDTPLSILKRAQKDGAADLIAATSRWKPWLPPLSDQGLQQGGAFVFEGESLLFSHYDPSTGAHADLDEMLRAALVAS